MKNLETLRAAFEALQTEVAELDALESPTDEQTARFDAAIPEAKAAKLAYDTAVERAENVEAIRTAALAEPKLAERGFSAPNVIVERSPYDNIDALRAGFVSPEDVVARALTAIEQADAPSERMAEATRKIETSNDGAGIARHILLTGSPAYRSGFAKFMKNPQTFGSFLTGEESEAMRAALSTTAANGGYLIPFLLDPTIVLTNSGTSNQIRQISRVESGTSNIWNGITSAGVTAEWKAEGSVAADASPTFGRPGITAYLADAYVFGSYEAFEDTNLASQIPMLVQDAKDRLEATAFTVGSGSGQPFGVVTSVTAVTASRVSPTTGGAFAAATEVYKVINAVAPRHRSKSSWLSNFTTYNSIRQFDTYGGSAFWADLSADLPPKLVGRPVYEASDMVSTVTTGTNLLLAGNFENYLIYDRVGVSLEYIPNVVDTSTGRPTGQRGFFATWRTGADVLDANAFRVLKL